MSLTQFKNINYIVPVRFNQLGNIEGAVNDNISKTFVGKCTLDDGYITRIKSIQIKDNIVSRIQPVILVNVKIIYETFDPKIGDVLDCKIVMMFSEGVWTEKQISDSISICVAIPKNNVNKEWNVSTSKFEGLEIGDQIDVRITNTHFDGIIKKYIGSLI